MSFIRQPSRLPLLHLPSRRFVSPSVTDRSHRPPFVGARGPRKSEVHSDPSPFPLLSRRPGLPKTDVCPGTCGRLWGRGYEGWTLFGGFVQ